jgi:predicted Fe-Mo cluster-binding NifX family protein
MKIAFTTKDTTWDSIIDDRFGRTDYLLFYDEENDELTHYDNRHIVNEAHGAGLKTAQKLLEFSPDILITGNGPGGNAANIIESMKVDVLIGAGGITAKEAYEKYKKRELEKF